MSDIGDRLRALFDDEARPIDPTYIPHTVHRKSSVHRRFSVRSGWQVGVAAGLIALVFGGSALLLRTDGDGGTAEQTVSATQVGEAGPAASTDNLEAASVLQTSIEWTQGSLPEGFNVHTITAAGGYFFGLAWDEIEEPNPRTRLWLSDDGSTWEAISVDATLFGMRAGSFQRVAAIGDGFFGIVRGEPLIPGAPDLIVVTSTDARTWVPANIGSDQEIPVEVYGGPTGGFVLANTRNAAYDYYNIWHTTDGSSWTLAASQKFDKIGWPALEASEGNFYLFAQGDGEGLWSSSDASEWTRIERPAPGTDSKAVPAQSPGGLVLFTASDEGSQIWLMSTDNTWVDVTPSGFDAAMADNPAYGDQFISSSDGGPAVLIDTGVSYAPVDPSYYLPATIWWSLDGSLWKELAGSEAFGFEGTIEVASAKEDTIVVVYYSHPDRIGSLWTGVLHDQLVDLEPAPATTAAPTTSPVHYTIELTGWVILNARDRLDGSDYVQIVKTDPEDLDHPEFSIITGPEAATVHRQLIDGNLPSLGTRSVQGTTATILGLRQGPTLDLLWVDHDGAPVLLEFTAVKEADVERILAALRPMTEEEWAAISVDLSTTTSSLPATPDLNPDSGIPPDGDPITDAEFLALNPQAEDMGFVSGTAVRLTWISGFDGRWNLGQFAAQLLFEGSGSGDAVYCVLDYGAVIGTSETQVGGGQCAPTVEDFDRMRLFGISGSGSCVEPVTAMSSVWGLPAEVGTVAFQLSDGPELNGTVINGVAQVVWQRDVQLSGITFEGMTEDQAQKIDEFFAPDERSCAEMNAA